MAMLASSKTESVRKLIKLLQDDFELPKECVGFDLHCHADDIVTIDVTYLPINAVDEQK